MPERAGNDGDESWAQTLITVTPEEDAAIRTITENAVISAVGETPLVLGVDQIADRRTVQVNTIRRGQLFIDTAELEVTVSHSDAGCQTFLQGVPRVEVPSVLRDEATQTMYLGDISPHTMMQRLRDITRIMNDRVMPVAQKVSEATQTVVTCEPDESRQSIVDRLTNGVTPEELMGDDFTLEKTEASYACATDTLNFVIARVLWLSDPGYRLPEVKLKDGVAQTSIKYDEGRGKVVLDADTQTSLTCEPRRSNTGLLREWSAMKEFAREIIDECLEAGVYPRMVVHSILDEVVDRCAGHLHLPYRDKTVQTLAPCNALKDRDDEVLRKLRLEVVLDSLESSIIVLPLVEILLENTCLEIRQKAPSIAVEIVNRVLKNSVNIAVRLAAIRREVVSHKPMMDDIFDARKKRLRELLQDKKSPKLCSSTQTELAGVPDIAKIKEPRETICSTCVRHSECYVCQAVLDSEEEEPNNSRKQDIVRGKMLRTQDILIAYNPCYLVTTPSKIPKIQPPVAPKRLPVGSAANKRLRPIPKPDLPVSASSSTFWKPEIDVCPPDQRSAKLKEVQGKSSSLNDWARVVQDTSSISGAWSVRGTISAESNNVISNQMSRKPQIRECVRSKCELSVRSVKALRILKKTFNRNEEESCSNCSSKDGQEKVDFKGTREETTGAISSAKTSEGSENQDDRPCGEGVVRIVPIIHVGNEIDED